MQIHEIKNDTRGQVTRCIAHFHALVHVDEFYGGYVWFGDGLVVGDFGVDAGYVVFYCVIGVPADVLLLMF